MEDKLRDERFRKAKIVTDLYEDRRYTQPRIADELHMSLKDVRRLLNLYNFEHTKKKDKNNVNEGQLITMMVCTESLEFLDKYDL